MSAGDAALARAEAEAAAAAADGKGDGDLGDGAKRCATSSLFIHRPLPEKQLSCEGGGAPRRGGAGGGRGGRRGRGGRHAGGGGGSGSGGRQTTLFGSWQRQPPNG